MPRPTEIRNGRGVWVLLARRGLTRSFKEFCDRSAHTGFVAQASCGIKQLQKNFEARGWAAAFYTDAHTSQWFFEGDRAAACHPDAAQIAWGRMIYFLFEHVKGGDHS